MPRVSSEWLDNVADVVENLLNLVAKQQTELQEYEPDYKMLIERTDKVLIGGQEVVHNIRSNAIDKP